MLSSIVTSITLTFKSRKHVIIACIAFVVMACVSIIVPAYTTPGNSILFQLSILKFTDIALIIFFSALFSISLAMQSYAFDRERTQKRKLLAKGTGTSVVTLVATIFSSKLCPLCIAAIVGMIGAGSSVTLFLLAYRIPIIILSTIILLFTIYLTGRRIMYCEKCK